MVTNDDDRKPINKRWLNADVGEGCDDSLIMPFLDCANIACGGHAGNIDTMKKTLQLAKKYQVMAGAHPAYPDQENFGRLSMAFTDGELKRIIFRQIRDLEKVAEKVDYPLQFVKPHGALNNDMCERDEIFRDICIAVKKANPDYFLVVPTGPREKEQQEIAAECELKICWEVFADRAYLPNGLLQPRREAGAVHQNAEKILDQLRQIMKHGTIRAVDGSILDVRHAQTICFHGDHAPSVEAIQKLSR